MIKLFVIEFGSFEVAPFMVWMALLALLSLFHAAVITLLFVHIFPNIFVAIHAHPRLRSLVEFLVALFTELFFLGMTFDDIARHQQFIGLCLHGDRKQQANNSDSSD